MNSDLKKISQELNKLTVAEQNAIAFLLDEELWNRSFKNSQRQLRLLADEAIAEYQKIK